LPVFVEAKGRANFAERFCQTVRSVLKVVDAADSFIEGELNEMSQIRIAATLSRRVLGSLNELLFLSRDLLDRQPQMDLVMLAAEVAETPCSLLEYQSPKSMTLALSRNRSRDA
jgi:hypothetical protein